MRETILVVPCYNEAARLAPEAFYAALQKWDRLNFLFVDDGSTDDTFGLLQQMAQKHAGRIDHLRLDQNGGKAEAVRRGVLFALDRTEGGEGYIGYWDADLATPLNALDGFFVNLEPPEVTLVIGSRVKLLGRQIERRMSRHYLGRIFATFASITLNLPVYDTQCGAKLFKARPAMRSVFDKPFVTGWIFDVELLARFMLAMAGDSQKFPMASVVEYPLPAWEDVAASKVRSHHFVVAVLDLLKIARRYTRRLYNLKHDAGAG